MYSYSAYDLRVRSVFELPELPVVDAQGCNSDVDIVSGDVDIVPDLVDGVGRQRIQGTLTRSV